MYKPGGAAATRKSSFTYKGIAGGNCTGAALGQLCSETIEPDRANESSSAYSLWQQTAYGYDAFGNRTTSAVTFKERDGTQVTRTTTTGYDARGRFATSTTYPTSTLNPVSLTETRQFDPRFGIATQVTDPNGVYVTKLLDGFGRVYGERRYNKANQKIGETFIAVETTGIAGNERYRQRQKASGGGEVEVYYDELQREVRQRARAFIDGSYATTTLAYDAAGRKSSATKPAGGGTLTTTWTYDTLNRLASETMAGTGLTLTTSYAY
ncbi:MAG TPA: hypothetical protein PLF26_20320, partial [Blastocatellia bacterium]|nr:hypothetical protein [Blastocatellia bacterium]